MPIDLGNFGSGFQYQLGEDYQFGQGYNVIYTPPSATDVQIALDQMRVRFFQYALYADYYDGRHSLMYATEKWRSTFANLFRNLTDNMCQIVVDAPAERMQIDGFGVEQGPPTTVPDLAKQIWQDNRMDVRAGVVHREAMRAGDAYLLVWPDEDGDPCFWPQTASTCTVYQDPENPNRLIWAAKAWVDRLVGRVRLNMYYPDRIEKYASTGSITNFAATIPESAGTFEPYIVDTEPWPVPNPWNIVPLFHFANNAWLTVFGRSELRSVIPLQDALNKTLCDQMVAQEFQAFPQRWAVGLEIETDPATGKAIPPFDPGADRLWAAANENIKFGQFDPANLKQYLDIEESLRLEIARIAALPPHFMQQWSGSAPSGEALKTAEARFVKKVQDRQNEFGNVWEDAMELALQMAGVADDTVILSCQWADAASTSEAERLNNVLVKQQIGISQDQALTEVGYGAADIQRMQEEKQASVDRARQAFNSGLPVNPNLPPQEPPQ